MDTSVIQTNISSSISIPGAMVPDRDNSRVIEVDALDLKATETVANVTETDIINVNKALYNQNHSVRFEMVEDHSVIKITDTTTDKVIREIPSETSRAIIDAIKEKLANNEDVIGTLINEIV
jgi:uncharacterized FlaG/YvyC family protein